MRRICRETIAEDGLFNQKTPNIEKWRNPYRKVPPTFPKTPSIFRWSISILGGVSQPWITGKTPGPLGPVGAGGAEAVVFTSELALRIFGYGIRRFYCGPDWRLGPFWSILEHFGALVGMDRHRFFFGRLLNPEIA